MEQLLEMQDITKTYPGTVACDKVNLSVAKGEVHTLLGENGAGKSTLMKILYGMTSQDSGSIFFQGHKVNIGKTEDAIKIGIGMVHQHFMLVPAISVVENVILSLGSSARGVFLDKVTAEKRIMQLSDKYDLHIDPKAKVEDLTVGQQQRVEILKAIYKNCELLILDEPTAVLTPQETRELFQIISTLKSEDKSVIFISHKLNEVMEISDRITVLRSGKVIGVVKKEDTDARQLARMMVGKDVLFQVDKKKQAPGEKVLEVRDLHANDRRGIETVRGIDLTVHAGEIYGIAGVDGNGQRELIYSITGLCKKSGEVIIGGKECRNYTPRQVLDCGVSHIPADRQGMGLVMTMSIKENLVLNTYRMEDFGKNGKMNWKLAKQHADHLITEYDIKTPDSENRMSSLSGGNQQKVVVARELDKTPRLLLAVNPTRGVDVGAIEFIHSQIENARDNGCAVLLISTELDEIMSLSDRIGVIYNGKIVGEMDRENANTEKLGLYMAGKADIAEKASV